MSIDNIETIDINERNDIPINDDNRTENTLLPTMEEQNTNNIEVEGINIREIMTTLRKLKFTLPFLALLISKLLVNTIGEVVIFIASYLLLCRLKRGLDEQIVLKKKCCLKELVNMIFSAISSILFVFFSIKSLKGRNILRRIIFLNDDVSSSIPCVFQTLWIIAMTDICIMIYVIVLKLLLFIISQSSHLYIIDKFYKKICKSNLSQFDRGAFESRIIIGNQVRNKYANTTGSTGVGSSTSKVESQNNVGTSDLVRRRDASNVFTSPECDVENQRSEAIDDDEDHSVKHGNEDSAVFLYMARLYLCVDVVFYMYRSLLPFPVWFHFYKVGVCGGFFSSCYMLFKIAHFCMKAGGAIEVVNGFFMGKLEYGQYLASSASQTSPSELEDPVACPICFDSPHRGVILNCRHVFCEACIFEWLDKEKSCPVCRTEVKSDRASFAEMKEQASRTIPVLI